jgi:hypothetical protein
VHVPTAEERLFAQHVLALNPDLFRAVMLYV